MSKEAVAHQRLRKAITAQKRRDGLRQEKLEPKPCNSQQPLLVGRCRAQYCRLKRRPKQSKEERGQLMAQLDTPEVPPPVLSTPNPVKEIQSLNIYFFLSKHILSIHTTVLLSS